MVEGWFSLPYIELSSITSEILVEGINRPSREGGRGKEE